MLRVPAPARHTQFSFRTGSPQGLLPLHAAERWESATDAHGSGDLTDEQKGTMYENTYYMILYFDAELVF